jgi:hypothetical protein
LLLELLERGLIGGRALGMEVMDMDVHSGRPSASLAQAF